MEKREKEMRRSSSSNRSNSTDKKGKGGSLSSIYTIFMHADAVDKWLMALGFLGAMGDGMSLPVLLTISSKMMNNIGNSSDDDKFIHNISKSAVNMVILSCAQWVASFLEGYCWTRTGERQAARMRSRYLKAVLRQDVEYFDLKGSSTSDVITSVSSDSLVIQDCLSEKVPNLIMNCSLFFGSYVVGFILVWRLALVAFPTVVLLIIPGLMYGRILMGLARTIREEYNKAGSIVEQAVSSVRTVYSFVGERRTISAFSASLECSLKTGLRQGLVKGIAIGSNGVSFAIWSFMAWYGSRLVMYHGGKGGDIFVVGVSNIMGGLSLGSALSNVKYFSEAAAAGERITEVINRTPGIDSESAEGDVLETVSGEVEFRSVAFAYPSRPDNQILRSFSLRVPTGETVALVGGSGSGKSTVIALLERFYDPSGGEILLDGVDIRRLRLKWLRSQMGLVSQEPALFATSIKDNILFGKEDASTEEVIASAKASNAHNFISQLPQGYDTQVGERGVQMSGGQKQRIAIARAILKSPKLLLLDEATSALDSESERIVQEALDLASVGRTTIVIAHRLSTIRNAGTIAVVQAGRVVEAGSHDELMRDYEGLYSSLVRLQQTKGAAEEQGAASPVNSASASAVEPNSASLGLVSTASRSNSARSSNAAATAGATVGNGAEETDNEPPRRRQLPAAPSFRRLLMLNAPEWKQALLGCTGASIFGGVQPAYSYALGSMISVYFLKDHDEIKSRTTTYSLVFLALAVLSLLLNIVQHYNFGAMGEHLTKRVRERMLSKMLTFEVGWFDRDENSSGAICARLAKDANVVRSLVGDRTALLVQTFSAVTVACTIGLVVAWRLAVVMIAIQPVIIVCFYARRVLLKSMSSKAIKAQSDSSKLAAEAVSNLRTITAFSSQDRILGLFEHAQEGPRRESIRQSWFAGVGLGTSQCLMTLSWALNFWYGAKLISQGHIESKSLFQTFMVLVSTGRVIADAGSMTTDLSKGADAVGSLFAVLDRATQMEPEDADGHQPEKLDGSVEISEVDFAYPARPDVVIFRGFSLAIDAGKSTALVGQSGSGKSTIIGLIERFYDPLRGSVRIDGRDVKAYHLRSLRRHIALVGQEPTLFSGSIRENIAYGAEGATETEVEDAARAANAHDFISCLKDGFDTWCGDRGVQLSGGQKQRIAIARAILKNPAILLLDEATSALDSQSEKVVQDALERVMVGRTSVVVAHRLSTIQNCDLIAVLEKGAVVEKGTHASLLAKGPNGAYYGLVRLQQVSNSAMKS
ncbi:putative multidrug resistance protein [Iris pallida]|uniref:Multidrug resistance protein n=1 Tax=Iris pallida TaxID=29817 RepID=A0AAX6FAP4_IRIPA|nr:putative multidrug resistance protein [Iris pallida]